MFERFWFATNGLAIAAMVWGAQDPAGTLATVAFWILIVFGSITAIAFFLGGIFNIFKDDDLAIEAIKFEEATAAETGFKPIFDEQILPILNRSFRSRTDLRSRAYLSDHERIFAILNRSVRS